MVSRAMSRNQSLAILACLLIPFAHARPASASEPTSTPAAPAGNADKAIDDVAGELFERGAAALKNSKWDECYAAELAAWQLRPAWKVAANLGLCEKLLTRYRDAAEHLEYALRKMPADEPQGRKSLIESYLDESSKQIVTLTIKTDPPDAEVFINGRSLRRGPFEAPIFVDVGTYSLEIRAEGRQTFKRSIKGEPGRKEDVDVTLARVVEPPLPPSPPPPPPKPPEGDAWARTKWTLAIASGAAAAVGVGLGIHAAIASNREANEALLLRQDLDPEGTTSTCRASPQPKCEGLERIVGAQYAWSGAATAGFITGGVFAAGSVGLMVWAMSGSSGAKKGAADRGQVVPIVGSNHGGVVVIGAW